MDMFELLFVYSSKGLHIYDCIDGGSGGQFWKVTGQATQLKPWHIDSLRVPASENKVEVN